ncbi:MAG TPA: dihydroneopterin aldolase [Alphaproteobacteria bacterium]|nr:dihydroneopterin aldolase [Alphaproteobacteria bacterium]
MRCVFIKNWKIKAFAGIHAHEKRHKQWLRLTVSLFQDDTPALSIDDVICYDAHKTRMAAVIHAQHHALLETLAENLATAAFEDAKVRRVVIEIEKLRILPGVESCGIRMERSR